MEPAALTVGAHAQSLTLLPPVLLWAAYSYRLAVRANGLAAPALTAYLAALRWLAVAMTLLIPSLARAVNAAVGIPNLCWLLMAAATLLSGFSATVALRHEVHNADTAHRIARRRRYAAGVLIAGLVGLFALALPQPEAANQDLAAHAGDPVTALLLTVFYTGLVFVACDFTPTSWRAADAAGGLLRLGLRGTAAAGAGVLGYVGFQQVVVVQRLTGHEQAVLGDPLAVSRVMLVGIAGLLAIGTTMPDWGPRLGLDMLLRGIQDYRSRRKMFKVWWDLCSCVPGVSLERHSRPSKHRRTTAAVRDVLTVREPAFRLHRRVIEIADGRLALRSFVVRADPNPQPSVLPGDRRPRSAVDAEAVDLAATIAAKLANQPTTSDSPRSAPTPAPSLDRWDLNSEVEHLERLAKAYRRLDTRPTIPVTSRSSG